MGVRRTAWHEAENTGVMAARTTRSSSKYLEGQPSRQSLGRSGRVHARTCSRMHARMLTHTHAYTRRRTHSPHSPAYSIRARPHNALRAHIGAAGSKTWTSCLRTKHHRSHSTSKTSSCSCSAPAARRAAPRRCTWHRVPVPLPALACLPRADWGVASRPECLSANQRLVASVYTYGRNGRTDACMHDIDRWKDV